ncbi:hypothetical protein DYY65_11500 [Nitrososphaera sp. AFS]|nr:hypothetical protein [Nitrososphaera sp. AFS]
MVHTIAFIRLSGYSISWSTSSRLGALSLAAPDRLDKTRVIFFQFNTRSFISQNTALVNLAQYFLRSHDLTLFSSWRDKNFIMLSKTHFGFFLAMITNCLDCSSNRPSKLK